jgi:hypothetical protein
MGSTRDPGGRVVGESGVAAVIVPTGKSFLPALGPTLTLLPASYRPPSSGIQALTCPPPRRRLHFPRLGCPFLRRLLPTRLSSFGLLPLFRLLPILPVRAPLGPPSRPPRQARHLLSLQPLVSSDLPPTLPPSAA